MPGLSEDLILQCINRHFPNRHDGVILGRGDDCAIFHPANRVCVSSDIFLENVHFRRSYFTPEDMGYKALAVNLSDLAAMGAKPLAFQLCLALPPHLDMPWLDEFFGGMAALAQSTGIALSGGDLSAAAELGVAITVIGEGVEGCALLRRGGSMPGDKLFLVGHLGLARIGLAMLEKEGRRAMTRFPESCAAHLRPVPKLSAGLMLGRAAHNSRPPALMDVSDGLARDLPRLLGLKAGSRELGAKLYLPAPLLHHELVEYARENHLDPCIEACLGGEDYALLGTCAPDMLQSLKAAIPEFASLGEVTTDGRFFCNDQDITELGGFDHFSGD